jgi:hypothetical protein
MNKALTTHTQRAISEADCRISPLRTLARARGNLEESPSEALEEMKGLHRR